MITLTAIALVCLSFAAPRGFAAEQEVKQPKINFIQYEFDVPSKEEGAPAGRFTISQAGGSVEANLGRWIDGFEAKGREHKKEELKAGGQSVHLVDIVGTYKDQAGGPFAGGAVVRREDYRMLGAIIVTEKEGQHFLKFYGPRATIDANAEKFQKMLKGLSSK
jgi:hypothetical protein